MDDKIESTFVGCCRCYFPAVPGLEPGSYFRGSLGAHLKRENGPCAHYVMVSKIQWKPFWLASQLYPQNDWTGKCVDYMSHIRTSPISCGPGLKMDH